MSSDSIWRERKLGGIRQVIRAQHHGLLGGEAGVGGVVDMVRASRLYAPYRAVGYITDGAPFAINKAGSMTFITCSIGNAFQVFESEKLRLSIVAPPLIEGGHVVALATQGTRTFVATEHQIQVWDRVSLKGSLEPAPAEGSRIVSLLLLGDLLLCLLDDGRLDMWDSKSLTHSGDMELKGNFRLGGVMLHPDTYLNKILVGDSAGCLTLWNIRSRKLVHEFTYSQQQPGGSSAPLKAITALEPSPAVDVVAVGRAGGEIELVNLRFDELVFALRQEKVPVTSMAFRTDVASQDMPMLVAGGQDGQIHVWDLKKRTLHSIIAAHEGPVLRLYFFPREPLLLSNSRDNSLKMWVFDASDGSARLLKSREGHTGPPRRVRYYGNLTEASMGSGADATSCQILSAGSDRALRVFNTARDSLSRELSQGSLAKRAKQLNVRPEDLKLRPIIQFAAVETRARDWANVVTCHEGDQNAYVWKFDQRALSKIVLRQSDWENNEMMTVGRPERQALSVAVSSCGNYGLVGTRGGVVYLYNMQSGMPRGAFPSSRGTQSKPHESMTLGGGRARPGSVWAAYTSIMNAENGQVTGPAMPEQAALMSKQKTDLAVVAANYEGDGHAGPVTGVEVDSFNTVVMSAGLDGTIRFWDFKTRKLIERVDIGVGVAQLVQARDSELLAAACDDFVVRVYDVNTHKLVRRLSGHNAQFSDMSFSRDGRRLVTASVDATLRVWDLPTGHCVDWLRFKTPVTGVTMSHTGEFLCTTHVDRLGLHLWSDKSFFQTIALDACAQSPYDIEDPVPLAEVGDVLPTMFPDDQEADIAHDEEQKGRVKGHGDEVNGEEGGLSERPKKPGLATLAMLPRAHWQTLFQLELIKQRNKPKEPPKAPPRAPFFLPTLHPDGVNPVFAPAPPSSEATAQPSAEIDTITGSDDVSGMMQGVWSDGEGVDDDAMNGDARRPTVVTSARNATVLPAAGGSRILGQPGGAGKKRRLEVKPTRSKLAELVQRACADADAMGRSKSGSSGRLSIAYEHVTAYLMGLSPPQVDLDLQALCLGAFDDEGIDLLMAMMRYLTTELLARRNFEAIQAYVGRFLSIYSTLLVDVGAKLTEDVRALRDAQVQANRQVKDLVQHNLCLLGFFASQQIGV